MSFQDLARADFKSIIAGEFSEKITVRTGVNSVEVDAIFDETYQVVDPQTNAVVMSTKPRVTIFRADVAFAITVGTSQVVARSKTFRVRDVQNDGEGSATLYLD